MTERTVCQCLDVVRALHNAMDETEICECIAVLEARLGDGPEFLCDTLKAALERMQGRIKP